MIASDFVKSRQNPQSGQLPFASDAEPYITVAQYTGASNRIIDHFHLLPSSQPKNIPPMNKKKKNHIALCISQNNSIRPPADYQFIMIPPNGRDLCLAGRCTLLPANLKELRTLLPMQLSRIAYYRATCLTWSSGKKKDEIGRG